MSHVTVNIGSETCTTMRAGTFCALSCGDLSSADFVTSTDTLALHKELRKVLGTTVRHGPFPVLDTERRALLLTLFSTVCGRLLSGRLIFCTFFPSGLLLSE
jgi:hypothetical protein